MKKMILTGLLLLMASTSFAAAEACDNTATGWFADNRAQTIVQICALDLLSKKLNVPMIRVTNDQTFYEARVNETEMSGILKCISDEAKSEGYSFEPLTKSESSQFLRPANSDDSNDVFSFVGFVSPRLSKETCD